MQIFSRRFQLKLEPNESELILKEKKNELKRLEREIFRSSREYNEIRAFDANLRFSKMQTEFK